MFAVMGGERFRVLGVRSTDPVMSVVGSVGLAASAGTALLVDMGNQLGGGSGRTLADLVGDGPRIDELSPGRTGVAVIRSGPVDLDSAAILVDKLASRWPAVVVRVGAYWPGAVVPVEPLYPGCLSPPAGLPAVWQSFPWSSKAPGPGPILPRLRSGEVRRVLLGGLPSPGRWLRAWDRVWELPWA